MRHPWMASWRTAWLALAVLVQWPITITISSLVADPHAGVFVFLVGHLLMCAQGLALLPVRLAAAVLEPRR